MKNGRTTAKRKEEATYHEEGVMATTKAEEVQSVQSVQSVSSS